MQRPLVVVVVVVKLAVAVAAVPVIEVAPKWLYGRRVSA